MVHDGTRFPWRMSCRRRFDRRAGTTLLRPPSFPKDFAEFRICGISPVRRETAFFGDKSLSSRGRVGMKPLRVLVADDDAAVLAAMVELCTALGHEVVAEARDGAEALERVAQTHPDLLLLDIEMPSLTGLGSSPAGYPRATNPGCSLSPATSKTIS